MKNRFSVYIPKGDFQFNSFRLMLYRLFLGNVVRKGRRLWADKVFLQLYNSLKQTYRVAPERVFSVVFDRLRPHLGVRPKKVGGVVYKLPFLLSSYKQNSLSVRWLIDGARTRKGLSFSRKLLMEVNDVYRGRTSASMKKKNELHRLAFSNRAFLR